MATSTSFSSRVADRVRNFKKGIDADEMRRKREETTVQIRKSQREEHLKQRRRMIPKTQLASFPNKDVSMSSDVNESELPKIAAMLQSLDPKDQYDAAYKLRRLLSNDPISFNQTIVNLGIVPLLVEFLKQHDRPYLQFEATWVLTNMVSGTTEHTEVVIKHGTVEQLCLLLLSSNEDVCDQAVWALGNIAGDSPQCRDVVLNAGAMTPLLAVLRKSTGRPSILENAAWTLSNFCRGKPRPDFALVSPALTVLPHLIHSWSVEVIAESCYALAYLTEGSSEVIQAVIESGVCSRVVDLLNHTLASIQTPALHMVGNIVAGTEEQTQLMLDLAVLPRLVPLLKHQKKLIRKEACWTISNITAGSQSQIQQVLDANVIPSLLVQLMSSELSVRKQAAWAIANITRQGTTAQVKYLVEQGCIPPLVKCLEVYDAGMINLGLDALEHILQAGEADMSLADTENRMAQYIEEVDGIEKIQNLQSHKEEEIYEKAMRIICDYFNGEDDVEDEFMFR